MVTDTPYFAVDSNTGHVVVRGLLDREAKDKHVIAVKATDMPGE